MAATVNSSLLPRHPFMPDDRRSSDAQKLDIGKRHAAKANVQKLDTPEAITVQKVDIDWMVAVGRAIERAIAIVGWSKKEAAAKVGVDEAEFGKWLSGARRPQFDRLFAIPELQKPLVISLAGLVPTARVSSRIDFPEAVNA